MGQVFSAAATASEGTRYTAVQLEVPGNPVSYNFWGIGGLSSHGSVAGYLRRPTQLSPPLDQAVAWDQLGSHQILPVPTDYHQAYANGFAGQNLPVGMVRLLSTESVRPAIWEPTGMRVLTTPTGFGQAVSGSGQYIGGFSLGDGINAIYWDAAGHHQIEGLDGRVSQVFSVNEDGWYVGPSFVDGVPNTRAGFIGRGGTSKLLVHPDFPNTLAFDINDNNWIVGEYRPTNSQRAYVWHDDQFIDLGLFPGFNAAKAYALNNDNTLVGGASNFGGDVEKALVWFNGATTPQDLNTFVTIPGATLINGLDINNAGQIFAEARLNDGSGYAYYVLTPIPEPAAGMALSLAIFALRCRRRVGAT